MDYRVEELNSVQPGEFRYEVTAELKDDGLGKALIELGLVKEEGLEFCLTNGKPSVRFRVITPVAIHIYPQIEKAQAILANLIREARRLEKLIQAIELVR